MTIQECMGGCGATEGLEMVVIQEDLGEDMPIVPQVGIYCLACLKGRGLYCERHRAIKLWAKVACGAEGESRVEDIGVCDVCAVEPVRQIGPAERARLVTLLERSGDVPLFLDIAEKRDSGWFATFSREERILAGVALAMALYAEEGDTLADAILGYVAQDTVPA